MNSLPGSVCSHCQQEGTQAAVMARTLYERPQCDVLRELRLRALCYGYVLGLLIGPQKSGQQIIDNVRVDGVRVCACVSSGYLIFSSL